MNGQARSVIPDKVKEDFRYGLTLLQSPGELSRSPPLTLPPPPRFLPPPHPTFRLFLKSLGPVFYESFVNFPSGP